MIVPKSSASSSRSFTPRMDNIGGMIWIGFGYQHTGYAIIDTISAVKFPLPGIRRIVPYRRHSEVSIQGVTCARPRPTVVQQDCRDSNICSRVLPNQLLVL